AVEIGRAIAEAAGRAHARGIIHRDLKPENVLFTAEGRPLIVDLGLAKHFRSDAPTAGASVVLSKTGEMRGTATYMAPEQILSARDVGPPADVFALGAIIYELLGGRPAFEGDTAIEVMAKISGGDIDPIETRRPDVPPWLARVVGRALERDPARRFPDGEALARALAEGPRARGGAGKRVAALGLAGLAA